MSNSKIFLSEIDKNQITIGSKTNIGVVEGMTLFRNWIVNGKLIGRWRNVYKESGEFIFEL